MKLRSRSFVFSLCHPIIAALVLANCGVAHAFNWGFLQYTPISSMRQSDIQVFTNSARKALETKQDGETLVWSNQGTGNAVAIHGMITPSGTIKTEDKSCRKLSVVISAKGQTETWAPTLCKVGRGKWKVQQQ